MKASALKYMVLSILATIVAVIIVLIPFHAFLTVWFASNFGHYTAIRLWKEVLLALCVGGVAYLMMADRKIRTHTLTRRLVQLILAYFCVQILWGVVAYTKHDVDRKALTYGWLIDMRFFLFFLVTWAVALRTSRLKMNWQKLLLWPAVIVILFGLLQITILPKDFLAHFGYSLSTIPAYETINHNSHYIRIASTLRGANPLGAYLLIPLSALAVFIARGRRSWRIILMFVALLVVLGFSFSRSAWIGALASLLTVAIVSIRSQSQRKIFMYVAGGCIVIVAILGIILRNNPAFENITLHTQTNSSIKQTSDAGHASALAAGVKDLLHDPLGRGPGTAGPASVYNNHPARIAENFFIQIGQETGWIGLLLFITINVGVGYLLWLGRKSALALTLFASLIGITIVNQLLHAWADDTLAYLWWGLAGIAISTFPYHEQAEPAQLPNQKSRRAKRGD